MVLSVTFLLIDIQWLVLVKKKRTTEPLLYSFLVISWKSNEVKGQTNKPDLVISLRQTLTLMAEVFNQPLLRIMISKPIMRQCLHKK